MVKSGEAVLVDVRPRPSYDAGHIPEATSLPSSSTPEQINEFLKQHPQEKPLVLYCSGSSCAQSQKMAQRLVSEFHRSNVKYMPGGFTEWQQAQTAPKPEGAP